ncbi:unnamed protein product [Closterium sp. NIES-53]
MAVLCHVLQVVTECQDNPASEQHVTAVESYCSVHCSFSRLDDDWRTEFGDEADRPHWLELFRSRVDIFALHYDAILAAMYALSVSAEGDCYLCVPPDPGIEAAALGASESALPGTVPTEALHSFTLDSGVSRCFFRVSTTFTPLPAPVPVRLADSSRGPVLAHSSTVLPCPAALSGSLSSLQRPSFTKNLVSTSGLVAAPCSYRLLWHQTLLWHHRLGHPSLPRLHGMHSRLLVSGLPRSLPPLPPSLAPPRLPCIEGWQRAAPHPSSFPLTTAPLHTLHMDVWGPARVSGQDREHYFLLVVDDYTCYTTVFPLRNKGELFTLPASPQQNGIAERRICLVMEVGRTSMIHAAAPHFFVAICGPVRCASAQPGPCVSLPETSPTLRWTGKVGDALAFWVWGSRAIVRDTSADKLSSRTIPCVFLGIPHDAPGWQFYHPTSRRVLSSQDITFNESVPFYRLFPYHTAPLPPLPLFLAPGPPPVDPLPPHGPAPSVVSQVDPLPGIVPVEVAVDSGAARGAASRGAASRGTASRGAEPASAEPEGGGGLGVLRLRVRSIGALPLEALELETLELETLALDALELEALALEALELEALELETLELEALALEALELEELKLKTLELEALALEALELEELELETMEALELETMELEALELEVLVMKALVLEALVLDKLKLEAVELKTLELVVLALGVVKLAVVEGDFECLAAALPHRVAVLLAPDGDPDAPDIPTPRSYAAAITGPYSSQWQTAMDAEMASWKSTSTFVDAVPPYGVYIVNGMLFLRVKWPPGSPPVFKASISERELTSSRPSPRPQI